MFWKAHRMDSRVRTLILCQHSGIAAVVVFMPVIAKDVTNTVFEISLIVASFSVAQIISEIYFGRMSDRRGKRLLFIRVGFAASAVVLALHIFADDALLLLLARIAGGAATGIMIPSMLVYAYESKVRKMKVASVGTVANS